MRSGGGRSNEGRIREPDDGVICNRSHCYFRGFPRYLLLFMGRRSAIMPVEVPSKGGLCRIQDNPPPAPAPSVKRFGVYSERCVALPTSYSPLMVHSSRT